MGFGVGLIIWSLQTLVQRHWRRPSWGLFIGENVWQGPQRSYVSHVWVYRSEAGFTRSLTMLAALGPQVKDPLPYVSAGIASIETVYADYDPTTSVIGLNYNGTTKGTFPHGWNTLSHFNTFHIADQPPVVNYNYSMIRKSSLLRGIIQVEC